MNKILLAIAVIAMLISCKKNINQVPKIENEIISSDIQVAVLDSKVSIDTLQQSDATYNYLGFGYDVTDRYDDANSVRAAVIDVRQFISAEPNRFDLGKSNQVYWANNVALNAADFSSQLSNRLNETKGLSVFKNSLLAKFIDDNAFDKKYVYGNYSLISEMMRLKINYNAYSGNDYLTHSFEQDIKILSAAELVKKYGTHVLKDIKLGAKLNVFYQAQTAHFERNKVSATGLRYAVKKVFGLATGELDPINLLLLNANTSAKIYYEIVGGDVTKLDKTFTNDGQFINLAKWHLSKRMENAVFIEISEDGLIPLYDLINEPQQKAAVKAFIKKYISEN